MFLSNLITHMVIHAIKPFLKANVHCSIYQIFGGQTSSNLWTMGKVKVIGTGVSYSVEGLGITMLKLSLH